MYNQEVGYYRDYDELTKKFRCRFCKKYLGDNSSVNVEKRCDRCFCNTHCGRLKDSNDFMYCKVCRNKQCKPDEENKIVFLYGDL